MRFIEALPRWREILLALFASTFASGLEFCKQAQGQTEPRRGDQSQMKDNPRDQQRSRRRGTDPSLKVGQLAPTFTLESSDGKESFDLREFRGQRPVVLIFGSYT